MQYSAVQCSQQQLLPSLRLDVCTRLCRVASGSNCSLRQYHVGGEDVPHTLGVPVAVVRSALGGVPHGVAVVLMAEVPSSSKPNPRVRRIAVVFLVCDDTNSYLSFVPMVSVHVEALFVTVALKGRAGDEMLPRIAADGQGTIMTISEYGVQRVGGVVESLPACCMSSFWFPDRAGRSWRNGKCEVWSRGCPAHPWRYRERWHLDCSTVLNRSGMFSEQNRNY